MAELFDTKELTERVILVGVNASGNEDTEISLLELKALAETSGAIVVGSLVQNREKMHPGTYLGKGKLQELKDLVFELNATGIICDDELTPAQMANMEDVLETKVMDRTLIILDIFAMRASTREGKIQVELAQQRYRATRLIGLGKSLSRLGGGIGTRGPGEKKLEVDRRIIQNRIGQLKEELDEVVRHREVVRASRSRNGVPVVAIVGYTNAGKSTLLNYLTDAGVLEKDQLFATLDPTTRGMTLENGQEVLMTDTVGFIRKLPHHLVKAFRSTLEEALYADMIIHVADASSPYLESQMHIVYETLNDLGIKDKYMITAFNKMDRCENKEDLKDFRADKTVMISAKSGENVNALLDAVLEGLQDRLLLIERVFEYKDAGDIAVIRKYGNLLEEEYRDNGIYVKAYVPKDVYARLSF